MSSSTKRVIRVGAWCVAGALMLAAAHEGPAGRDLSAFDGNGDGAITKEEFAAASATLATGLQAKFLEKFDSIPTGQTAGDGIITSAEAKAVFEEQATDWLEHILEAFDANDDGAISAAEASVRGRQPGHGHLDELDANDDGTISNAELVAAAAEKAGSQLERFLDKYDSVPVGATAGDGVITTAESLAVAQAAVAKRVESVLERFDSNDDGAVSAAEIDSVLGKRPGQRGGPGGRQRR